MLKKIVKILFLLSIIVNTNMGLADILVVPIFVNFLPNQLPVQNVMVVNRSDSNAYINVTSYLVEHPGTKLEKKVHFHDPSKLGLLVSPSKLIIPPRQHRMLRIMQLSKHLTKDKIYRVVVAPVPNALIPVGPKAVHDHRIGIRVLVAYGILVTARPEHINRNLVIQRHGKTLLIENKGNTNVVVTGGQQCANQHCFNLPRRRMYVGNRWQVKLPFNKPISIATDCLGKQQHIKV